MSNEITTHSDLLDNATTLNQQLEKSYLGLALVLVAIEETGAYKEAGYEDFATYYREDLGREKSTVSRLLHVGRWLRDNKLAVPTVSYRKLSDSIKRFPNEKPEYVLAVAQSWSASDFMSDKRESCEKHEFVMKCRHCGQYQDAV